MEVVYWETNRGRSPVLEFIIEQQPKARVKIQKVIDYFEERGKALIHSTYLTSLSGHDLYELRIRFTNVFYRIFVVIKDTVAWLVHGFKKKTNETPQKEISVALKRKALIETELALAYQLTR